MLEIRAITTIAEFLSMRADWDGLLDRARAANIFLSFDWLTTWWWHYGGKAQLYILAVYEERELIGLAPLMVQQRRLAGFPVFRKVAFIGTEISDRLDVILTPGKEQAILSAMVSHLQNQRWDIVDLQEVPEESMTLKLLPEVATSLSAEVEVTEQSVCPVLSLPSDPNTYLVTLSRRLKKNIGYYSRRLSKEHVVRFDFVRDGSQLDGGLDAFFGLYRKYFANKAGTQHLTGDQFTAFRYDVAKKFSTQGRLLLSLCWIDGNAAAGELCFLYHGSCFGYNFCYDPVWEIYSLGTLLQWEELRYAMAIGCHDYDFLRGEEEYKYRWRPRPRRHLRIRIIRKTPKLRLLFKALRLLRSRLPQSGNETKSIDPDQPQGVRC
jgi:CelD/BcsL family acetyltransferase involved in cellulose biosynthesis